MFVVSKIEGNSKIGNAVYSKFGVNSNCRYHMFMPTYEVLKVIQTRNRRENELQQQIRLYKEYAQ